jgi:hypothetical protein
VREAILNCAEINYEKTSGNYNSRGD